MTVTVGDLFCGAGGFSHGVKQIGWEIKWGVDINEKAVETWNENHQGVGVCGDLTSEEIQQTIQEDLPQVDVLIGGPPCKDFSKSNRVIDKGRNNLVLTYMDYVSILEPNVFVIENVRQLETQYTDILENVYEIGSDCGYTVSHKTLNAADYGVPQDRIRVFIIGVKDYTEDLQFPKPSVGPKSPAESDNYVTAGQALQKAPEPSENESVDITSKYADLVPEIPPGLNYSYYTDKLGHPEPKFEWRSRFSDFLYKADPNSTVKTIKAKPGASSGPFHWDNRRFTITEQAMLQSFPRQFIWPKSQTASQELVGNAVPPKLARAVGDAINKQVYNVDLQFVPSLIETDEDLDIISRRRTSTKVYKKRAKERISEVYGEEVAPNLE